MTNAPAWAACLALERGAPGVYNIAAANRRVSTEKAAREPGWHAGVRLAK